MKAIFQLETLTCPSCVKKIETTLNKTAGVDSAEVFFTSGKVKIQFNETQIDVEKLQKTVQNLGYTILSTKVAQ